MALVGLSKRLNDVGVKLPIFFFFTVCLLSHQNFDLEVLTSRWSTETHTLITYWWKFTPMLEDVLCMTCLPLFGGSNAIGFELIEDDHTKMKFLTMTMVASRSSGKSTHHGCDTSTRRKEAHLVTSWRPS